MPNHVTTIIRTDSDEAYAAMLNADGHVDFNLIVPMPEALKNIVDAYTRTESDHEAAEINAEKRANKDRLATIMGWDENTVYALSYGQEAELKREYGENLSWYPWNTTNWGTKWNAYDTDTEREYGTEPFKHTVQFDTAWSHPKEYIKALSAKFPEAVLCVSYADEDLGSNLGEYHIRGGIIRVITMTDEMQDEETRLDFAAQIKYGQSYAEMKAEWGEDE